MKSQKGITLIWLVVIILLIIFAGMSVSIIARKEGSTNIIQNTKEQNVLDENIEELNSSETSISDVPNQVTREDFFIIDSATGELSIVEDTSENHDGIGYYYNDAGEKILPEEHIVIPEKVNGVEVKSIKGIDGGFYHASNLKSVVIPNTVTSINNAFEGCTSLTEVTIPNSVTTIDGSFRRCTNLTSIIIPKNVGTIKNNAFSGCTNLTSITIEEGSTLTVPEHKWGAINATIY